MCRGGGGGGGDVGGGGGGGARCKKGQTKKYIEKEQDLTKDKLLNNNSWMRLGVYQICTINCLNYLG